MDIGPIYYSTAAEAWS